MREIKEHATAATKARYSRIAPVYDLVEIIPELRYRSWRSIFWDKVSAVLEGGNHILEVGVGTGKNMQFWPRGASLTAIDLTPGMVARAQKKATKSQLDVDLREGDVQALEFPDNSFDVAVATFVFCSVPDPILGLEELSRVVKPDGHILMMEHVRSENVAMGKFMDWVNPIVRSIMGPNINRDTVSNVVKANFYLSSVENLDRGGIFKIIHARNPTHINGRNT
jgi:ubiquinone/menaquinone biosynthesis C-methylase UbiE